MEIKDWKPFSSGNLKGYFRLITSEGFEIKGMKLLEGEKGMFVGSPSVKGRMENIMTKFGYHKNKNNYC